MGTSQTAGHAPVFEGGKISHAYIITGPDRRAREQLAEELACTALCSAGGKTPCGECRNCQKVRRGTHPDVIYIDKPADKREILVDQIRGMAADASVLPNEADRKVYIIRDAGDMNQSAQNSILKILEEPPRYIVIVLSAENPMELLATVRSRCISIDVHGTEDEISEDSRKLAEEFLDAAGKGEYELSAYSFLLDKLTKQEYSDFIEASRFVVSERIKQKLSGKESGMALRKLMKISDAIEKAAGFTNFNVSAVHISGLICGMICGNED